jgi:hypothetical protein
MIDREIITFGRINILQFTPQLVRKLMNKHSIRDIIRSNISRYPLIQVKDLYKLSHQAALGSEHAVKDIESARERLRRELDEIKPSPSEPLVDEISADGEIVRVNLRPYRAMHIESESLLQAFVKTANEYQGSILRLELYLQVIEEMVEKGEIYIQLNSLRSLIKEMESSGYPALHH